MVYLVIVGVLSGVAFFTLLRQSMNDASEETKKRVVDNIARANSEYFQKQASR